MSQTVSSTMTQAEANAILINEGRLLYIQRITAEMAEHLKELPIHPITRSLLVENVERSQVLAAKSLTMLESYVAAARQADQK